MSQRIKCEKHSDIQFVNFLMDPIQNLDLVDLKKRVRNF